MSQQGEGAAEGWLASPALIGVGGVIRGGAGQGKALREIGWPTPPLMGKLAGCIGRHSNQSFWSMAFQLLAFYIYS